MSLSLVFCIVCITGLFFLSATAKAQEFITISTGGVSGTYYPVGTAIANLINKYAKGLKAVAETSNASVANCHLIAAEETDIAFVQSDVASWAYNGLFMFKKPVKSLRAIALLYPEHIQILTVRGSGINTIQDLIGARVSVGAPGSGVEADARIILAEAGIKYKDMEVDFLGFGESIKRLEKGELDAVFVVAGYPTKAIVELSKRKQIRLLEIKGELRQRLIKKYKYFKKAVIPEGAYRGLEHDVQTIAVTSMLVCSKSLPEHVVYKFTKTLWDHIDEIRRVHPKLKDLRVEKAVLGTDLPLHPGAEKYYKEEGIILK